MKHFTHHLCTDTDKNNVNGVNSKNNMFPEPHKQTRSSGNTVPRDSAFAAKPPYKAGALGN